jgi:hypothetical protein
MNSRRHAESVYDEVKIGSRSVAGLVNDGRPSTSRAIDEDTTSNPAVKKAPKPRQKKARTSLEDGAAAKSRAKKATTTEPKPVPKKKMKARADAVPKKPRKPRAKSNGDGDKDLAAVVAGEEVNGDPTSAKSKKRKRTNAELAHAMGELSAETVPQGRARGQNTKGRAPKKQTSTTSSHFNMQRSREVTVEASHAPVSPPPLNIPLAVKRRNNWTPTKETAVIGVLSEDARVNESPGSPTSYVSPAPSAKTSFSSILGGFTYSKSLVLASPGRVPASNVGLNKRRKVEVSFVRPSFSPGCSH